METSSLQDMPGLDLLYPAILNDNFFTLDQLQECLDIACYNWILSRPRRPTSLLLVVIHVMLQAQLWERDAPERLDETDFHLRPEVWEHARKYGSQPIMSLSGSVTTVDMNVYLGG